MAQGFDLLQRLRVRAQIADLELDTTLGEGSVGRGALDAGWLGVDGDDGVLLTDELPA
jgi:hypothetical protein